MKNSRWLNVIKWVWVVVVFLGIIYYFSKNYLTLLKYIGSISIPSLLVTMLFLLIGKLLLTRLSIQSVWGQPWIPPFSKMFYINSMMQLAKYLPGGVWQFVGRFGLYRTNGLSNTQAGKSILVENIWLVSSAIYFGAATITLTHNELVFRYLPVTYQPWMQTVLVVFIILAWAITIFLLDWIVFTQNRQRVTGILSIMGGQLLAWTFLGAAFWVPLLSINQSSQFAGIAIGSFALSWVVGYVTIFAPSGLGVREAVLTLILAGTISPEAAVVYTAVNRLVWIVVEVLLGLFCELFFGSGKLSRLVGSKGTNLKEPN